MFVDLFRYLYLLRNFFIKIYCKRWKLPMLLVDTIAIISDNHAANQTVHNGLQKNFPLPQSTSTISAENVEWTQQTFKIAHPCYRR